MIVAGKFQFHKGTIKTGHRQGPDHPYPVFQFHKGTIKTGSRAWQRMPRTRISIP